MWTLFINTSFAVHMEFRFNIAKGDVKNAKLKPRRLANKNSQSYIHIVDMTAFKPTHLKGFVVATYCVDVASQRFTKLGLDDFELQLA
jgi:hypothetical protein